MGYTVMSDEILKEFDSKIYYAVTKIRNDRKRDHMLDCNHLVASNDFKVLGRESNHWVLEIKDILFIKRDGPSLNKNIYSQDLFLF